MSEFTRSGRPIPVNAPSPRDYATLLLRLVIGGVLVYAGFSKAIAPNAEFAGAIAAYKVLPIALVRWVALVWPWIELLTGTYLVFGYFTRIFAQVAGGMFGIFLAVVLSALLRKIDPGSCGCFGLGLTFPIRTMVLLDSGFFTLSLLLTVLSKTSQRFSVDRWASQ